MDIMRFATAARDDGKSTHDRRLLYDSKSIFADQLEAVERPAGTAARSRPTGTATDGWRAEREQGITIDVAYRYFGRRRRKFIIAGHPWPHPVTPATW